MNYIKQMKAFREHRKLNPLSANAVALYLILFEENNEQQFPENFRLNHSYIKDEIGLCDREYRRARDELVQGGYILYIKSGKRAYGVYAIIDLCDKSPQIACRELAANPPENRRESGANSPETCREMSAKNQHSDAENTDSEKNSCRESAANSPDSVRELAANPPEDCLSSYLYKNNKHKTINYKQETPPSPPAEIGDEDSPPPELKGQTFDQIPPDEEKSINAICECWRKYIGEPPIPLFRLARSHLRDGAEEALICKAIEISALSADKPMKYLPVVLQNWKKEGIQTLAAYEAAHPEPLPKTSGQAYSQSSSRGNNGLSPPSYDLDEVERLLNQEVIQRAREQGKVV